MIFKWRKRSEEEEEKATLHTLLLHSRFRARRRRPMGRTLYRAGFIICTLGVIGTGLYRILF